MAKINPWLAERIARAEPKGSPLNYVVEVIPGFQEQVKAQLVGVPQMEIATTPADRFIAISAPSAALPYLEQIPEIVKISADTLSWIKSPSHLVGLKTNLKSIFRVPEKFDPYLDYIQLSPVEVPVGPLQALALSGPRILSLNASRIYTTDQQRTYIGLPAANKIKTRCAVADTGLAYPHFLIHLNSSVELKSTVPFEPIAQDGLGHGTWCSTAAFGDDANHPRYGRCEGAADPAEQLHVKCLSNLGFGMTSWILEAIYQAWVWGAKILSLSLGGPLQGSAIEDDPQCRLISALKNEMICVVAAGNDGVPWSIGSPGVSPDALTVGAWSMTDHGPSWFSSRGPSGEFYRDHQDIWLNDFRLTGEDLLKPDVCVPGGGRVSPDAQDELILSGAAGWMDPYSDPLPGWGSMKGTSMATPCAAGAVAILFDQGVIRNAADVKRQMAKYQAKNSTTGYGLLTFGKLT